MKLNATMNWTIAKWTIAKWTVAKWTIAKWTVAGAAFGAIFGALASIFQGGPAVIQGIQETWWWFAIAGFLTGMTDMTGSNNGAGDPSIQSP